jgi:hypothetical protein
MCRGIVDTVLMLPLPCSDIFYASSQSCLGLALPRSCLGIYVTCPMPCPLLTGTLSTNQNCNRVRSTFWVVFITIKHGFPTAVYRSHMLCFCLELCASSLPRPGSRMHRLCIMGTASPTSVYQSSVLLLAKCSLVYLVHSEEQYKSTMKQ